MKLTTKGRYAVTAMLDLALHGGVGKAPVPLAEVSRRQRISLSYLEQIFLLLRRRNLVVSVRGPGGGYRLGHPAEEISIAAIVAAVNESVDTTACGGAQNCKEEQVCLSHQLWSALSERIRDYLTAVTLAQLMQRNSPRLCAGEREGYRSLTTAPVEAKQCFVTDDGVDHEATDLPGLLGHHSGRSQGC